MLEIATVKLKNLTSKLNAHKDFRKISSNSIGVLIVKVFGAFLVFFAQIPLTRLLGVEQYGLYVYVLSWVMILAAVVPLGTHTTVAKYFPAYKTKELWGHLKGLFILVFTIAIGVTLLLSALVAGGVYLLRFQNTELYSYFPAAALLLLLFSLTLMITVFLRSLKRVIFTEILENIGRPVVLVAAFLIFFNLYPDAGAHNAIWANNVAVFLLGIVLFVFLLQKMPKEIFSARADFSEYKEWFALALPMMLMSGMNYLLNRTDIIMLGAIGDIADAGLYGVASRVSDLSTFGLLAVHSILVPMVSESWQKGEIGHTQKLLTLAAWFVFIFSLCASVALILLGPYILPIFGSEFSASYAPMLLLLLARFIPTLVGPVVFMMALVNKQKLAAKILFFTVSLNIAGNAVLIPVYGMMGAAASTAISFFFWNVIMFVSVVKTMRINPSILPLKINQELTGGLRQ